MVTGGDAFGVTETEEVSDHNFTLLRSTVTKLRVLEVFVKKKVGVAVWSMGTEKRDGLLKI